MLSVAKHLVPPIKRSRTARFFASLRMTDGADIRSWAGDKDTILRVHDDQQVSDALYRGHKRFG
jgi:hypothetical protein